MPLSTGRRVATAAKLLLREQCREPVSFIWVLASPVALYYFQTLQRPALQGRSYLHDSAWFHAYVAITLSLFGFAYYLIGRRESGFMRSFAYHRRAIALYVAAHYLCFGATAVVYASLFYLATVLPYGAPRAGEWLHLLHGFMWVFVAGNAVALLCSLAPWRFQSAGIIFSACSLGLLAASALPEHAAHWNPVPYLRRTVVQGPQALQWLAALLANGLALWLCATRFRINPVWSRYA